MHPFKVVSRDRHDETNMRAHLVAKPSAQPCISVTPANFSQRRAGEWCALLFLCQQAAGQWNIFLCAAGGHAQEPADEARQHGMPGLEGLLHHLACCRIATLTCCTAFWLLTADMCSRSLHACRRRSYDSSRLLVTMPTRTGDARRPLADWSHRCHAVRHELRLRISCGNVERPGQSEDVLLAGPSYVGPGTSGVRCP